MVKFTETYIIPFGMLKAMEKLYSHVKNYHIFQVLPERVKTKSNISSELFKKQDLNLVVSHQGNLSYKIFDYVYCSICQKDKFQWGHSTNITKGLSQGSSNFYHYFISMNGANPENFSFKTFPYQFLLVFKNFKVSVNSWHFMKLGF